jgi:hypothetical protein
MGDDIATCRFSALLVFLVCCMVGCGDSTSPPTCPANAGVDISVSRRPEPHNYLGCRMRGRGGSSL